MLVEINVGNRNATTDISGHQFAILARVRGADGRPHDVTLGGQGLHGLCENQPGSTLLNKALQSVCQDAAAQVPGDGRLISVVGIGFGPAPFGAPSSAWNKADFDPEKHPRWPAGAPESQGGEFSPNDGSSTGAGKSPDSRKSPERPSRLRSSGGKALNDATRKAVTLATRRAVRTAALDALKIGLDLSLDTVPVVDMAFAAKTALDIYETLTELHQLKVNIDALQEFVAGGSRTLDQLRMSSDGASFPSFRDFKKLDDWEDELAKRFGAAGPGYLYHHIIEQSSGLPVDIVQNSDNIVRIPRLLHEEINAVVSTSDGDYGNRSLHEWLKDKPIEVHREEGLKVLRDLGILKPEEGQQPPAKGVNLGKREC